MFVPPRSSRGNEIINRENAHYVRETQKKKLTNAKLSGKRKKKVAKRKTVFFVHVPKGAPYGPDHIRMPINSKQTHGFFDSSDLTGQSLYHF